ncbi:MAG: hypothetical protein QM496_05160 [Verrucomicrobiota bacterium]
MSIIKTAFFLLVLVSIAMGGIYVKNNASLHGGANRIAQIAPIIIGNNGAVRFPNRVPSPETVYQIQTAVQTDDAQALNDLLVKHRFYVLPGRTN